MIFYLALRAGLLAARLLPARVFIGLVVGLFRLAALVSPARRTVERNLAAIAKAKGGAGSGFAASVPASKQERPGFEPGPVFASYGRYWGELLAQAARPGRELLSPLHVSGEEHLARALAAGPVCVLTAHLGNWDLLLRWWSRQRGGRATVVAERVAPPRLFRLFGRLRGSLGARVVEAEGGGLTLYRELRAGRICALVADRVFGAGTKSGNGVRCAHFLGAWRRFPSAGMDLARRAGATLLPIFLLREEGAYAIKVHPPLPADRDPVASFAAVLAEEILRHPEQWCVLYPLHDAARETAYPAAEGAKGAASS